MDPESLKCKGEIVIVLLTLLRIHPCSHIYNIVLVDPSRHDHDSESNVRWVEIDDSMVYEGRSLILTIQYDYDS